MIENVDEFFKGKIKEIIHALKPYDKEGHVIASKKSEEYPYPEYYPGYNKIVSEWESILVHAEKGVFPTKLLGERSPNQTQEEYNYIKKNYKQITQPVFVDASNSVKRCWNDGNWNIVWPKDEDLDDKYAKEETSLRGYLENGIKTFHSLENYARYLFPDLKLKDANGCHAIRPIEFKATETENGIVYETDELSKPVPIYFNCKQVILFKEDDWYILESNEKSVVKYGSTDRKIGRIYELYTKDEIWIARQSGKYTDFTFEIFVLMRHELGFVPVKRNMGIPILIEGVLHYQSPFLYATDNLDLVILNASNLQISVNNCVYPIRVMIGNECEFQDQKTGAKCTDGKLWINNIPSYCPSCNGSGLKTRLGPLSTILIRPKTRTEDAEIKASDAIHYASPEMQTLEFLLKKIADDESRARDILHLKTYSDGQTGENVVESGNNTKANYAFIKPISDQIFGWFQWAINTIGQYREGASYKQIVVKSPYTFDFLTENDYLNQIKSAIQAQLPPFVIYTIVYKFLNTLYYNDEETAKRFHLIMEADRLLTLSENAISLGLTKGTIENWEVILHQSAINLIAQLERDNDKFWELKIDEQVKKLQEIAKLKEKEIKEGDPIEQFVAGKQSGFSKTNDSEEENKEEETEENPLDGEEETESEGT